MKNILICCMMMGVGGNVFATDLTDPYKIHEKVRDAVHFLPSSVMEVKMTLYRERGQQETRTVLFFRKIIPAENITESAPYARMYYMIVTDPAQYIGMTILALLKPDGSSDKFLLVPGSTDPQPISPSDLQTTMLGGMTNWYEELLGRMLHLDEKRLLEDGFVFSVNETGRKGGKLRRSSGKGYTVELTPKEQGATIYDRVVGSAHKGTFVPEMVVLYKGKKVVRHSRIAKTSVCQGRTVIWAGLTEDHLNKERTITRFLSVRFVKNEDLNAGFFTESNMGKDVNSVFESLKGKYTECPNPLMRKRK